MIKTRLPSIIVLIALIGVIFSAPSFGDEIDSLVKSVDDNIKTWHIFFWVSLISIITVAVLGALIAIFQGLDQVKYKVHIIFFGAIITMCTFISNSFLKGDYRLYDTIEKVGLVKKVQLNALVEKFKNAETAEAKNDLIPEILKKTREITLLENQSTLNESSTALLEFQIINSAYAASAPNWINSLPEDTNYLYFVGYADSKSIANLETAANENAIQNAATYMAEQFSPEAQHIDIEKLAKLIADSAELYSSYISSSDNKIYRYYSLIRISKNTMKTGAKLFGIANNVNIPDALLQKIDVSQRARDDYTAKQTKLYESLDDQAKNKLTPDLYSKYLKARQLRKEEQQYPEAISLLKEILRQSPDFYLGWYNLALAYDYKKEFAAADEAYKKAIELEPSAPSRDASIYNSYGLLLDKHGDYPEAYIQYEKSLKLDPNNPRTQNNYLLLKKKLNR